MHHFNAVMSDNTQPNSKKQMVYELYSDTFELLINFCSQNEQNQLVLYEHLNGLLQYLHYDVGQIKLLCEVYKNNISLLKEKSNRLIIQTLIELLLDYGRQHRILDFFIVFQKCHKEYLFDNQLLILNTFLPINDLGEDELILLYSSQKSKSQLIFDFKNEDMENNELPFIDYFLLKKTAKRDDTFTYHAKLLKVLLLTTYKESDDKSENQLNTKQNFNISISKLKVFDFQNFKFLLGEDDNFKLKQEIEYLISPKKNEFNIQAFQNNSSQKTEVNMTNSYMTNKKQIKKTEFEKQGLTYLKPYIIDFLKIVYILGEGSQNYQGDSSPSIVSLESILKSEGNKIENINSPLDISEEYVEYIFDHIIPFLQAYFDKYLSNIQSINERERKDLLVIYKKNNEKQLLMIDFKKQDLRNFVEKFQKIMEDAFDGRITEQQNINMTELMKSVLYDDNFSGNILKVKETGGKGTEDNNDKFNNETQFQNQRANSINFQKNISLQSEMGCKDSSNNLFSPSNGKQKRKSVFSEITKKIKNINILKQISKSSNSNIEVDQKIPDTKLRFHWACFLKCLNQTDKVKEEINNEKLALTEAILEAKQLIPQEVIYDIEPKPDRFSLIKKCIIFLQYAVEDPSNKVANKPL